jgi:hypothetical protein
MLMALKNAKLPPAILLPRTAVCPAWTQPTRDVGVAVGLGEADGVAVGVGVLVCVMLGLGDAEGVAVGVALGLAVGLGEGVAVGVGVMVAVGVSAHWISPAWFSEKVDEPPVPMPV